jgi:cobalamin biosynthesis protein CobT
VVTPVAWQEGNPAARHLADEHRLARLAERGLHLHLFAVGEELVEAGTSDDPDVSDRSHGRQATFSPDELADEAEDEEDPEDEDEAEDFSPDFSPPAEDDEDDEAAADESAADPADAEAAVGADAEDPLLLSVR